MICLICQKDINTSNICDKLCERDLNGTCTREICHWKHIQKCHICKKNKNLPQSCYAICRDLKCLQGNKCHYNHNIPKIELLICKICGKLLSETQSCCVLCKIKHCNRGYLRCHYVHIESLVGKKVAVKFKEVISDVLILESTVLEVKDNSVLVKIEEVIENTSDIQKYIIKDSIALVTSNMIYKIL